MNTPAHLIFGATAFGKPKHRRVTVAALIGALSPDISLYLMVGWSIYVRGIEPRTVFREYYYSSEWQQVFAVDNSFILWGLLFVFALWTKRAVFYAFAGAGLLHLCLDFPLHNHDARMHFWPLTDWVFVSPFSYWDNQFHAGIVGPLELSMAMLACVALMTRHRGAVSRGGIVFLGMAEVIATGFFGWFF